MKKIKSLDKFENLDEKFLPVRKKDAPEKAKFRFEITDNLRKVSRIKKSLIDARQLLSEMSDEVIALRVNFPKMDPESMEVMNNMSYNLKNLIDALEAEDDKGSESGMFDNMGKLERNLNKLKQVFTKPKGK